MRINHRSRNKGKFNFSLIEVLVCVLILPVAQQQFADVFPDHGELVVGAVTVHHPALLVHHEDLEVPANIANTLWIVEEIILKFIGSWTADGLLEEY